MLTNHAAAPARVLPAIADVGADVTVVRYDEIARLPASGCVLLDGTGDLSAMVAACRSPDLQALAAPIIVIAPMHSLAVLKATWGFHDWVLPECGPNELLTRLRLAADVRLESSEHHVTAGGLHLDADTFSVQVYGSALNLTYTEFELLRALVSSPGQVWTRAALLRDVWNYQHPGGTRTVDVHVRRLRAKLGPELAAAISTVRKVGYKFVAKPATA